MDLGKVIEGPDVQRGHSAPTDTPLRSSTQPALSKLPDDAVSQARQDFPPPQSSPEVWAGALARMQTQVSYNTSMLESNRRHAADLEQALGRLHADLGSVFNALNATRAEIQARPLQSDAPRHDAGDFEVLAGRLASIGSKVSDVDGLKMQIELLKNRVKRCEEQASPPTAHPHPGTSAVHRESYEPLPTPQQQTGVRQQQQLPSLRAATMMSPTEQRHQNLPPPPPPPPVLLSQSSSFSNPEPRASEPPAQHTTMPGFRSAEALPPPSAISGWRSAEPYPPSSLPPPPPPPPAHPFRPTAAEPESQSAGWAAVNSSAANKRPLDEVQRSPLEHPTSAPGSPKRQRLAPIMPRSAYEEERHAHAFARAQQPTPSASFESNLHSRQRTPSDPSQPPGHGLPTLAAAGTGPYRFIHSQQANPHGSWRPEGEMVEVMPHSSTGRGRGGRRGGRGRGRGGRGGSHHQHHGSEEHGTSAEWSSGQNGTEEHYEQAHLPPAGSPNELELDNAPSTPNHDHEPIPVHVEFASSSAGKKSRTKPIRNAEGILIRKDGRPDMRSVSSANNLRKVHAKKEAERAEIEGRTPTSVRSLAPAQSTSVSEEEERVRSGTPGSASNIDDQETQERHQELIGKIFPHSAESVGSRALASTYFPRRDDPTSMPETVIKTEGHEGGMGQEEAAAANSCRPGSVPAEDVKQAAEQHAESRPQEHEHTEMPPREEEETGEMAPPVTQAIPSAEQTTSVAATAAA